MSGVKFYWNVLKNTISKAGEKDIFTNAAALSYYTIFSLPPILLIILFVSKLFYSLARLKGVLFPRIEELVGKGSAKVLIEAIENVHVFEPTIWATILSIGILIFTSTTVLVTMQDALNKIFDAEPKSEGVGFFKMIKGRILSFVLLVIFALILLISLIIDAIITAFGSYLEEWIIGTSMVLTLLTSATLSFVIITLLVATIFKFLPDIELPWKDIWFGAVLTSIFFEFGKHLVSFYIGKSNISGLYDAAGSVMVIMVWIFYASLIILFGATFIHSRLKMKEKIKKAV